MKTCRLTVTRKHKTKNLNLNTRQCFVISQFISNNIYDTQESVEKKYGVHKITKNSPSELYTLYAYIRWYVYVFKRTDILIYSKGMILLARM